ncbi:hypothetical protein JOD64_000703 [Micromonospora luteifusca]|uniref:Ricin B lectin domain-containing protein n=1 Tax=Micromonospora luteifusca TaxID=709860 RepID=A0ABS2LMR6_9ACTN|nr:ricin-type beta-trefoil lectin domain protein [Micromonospora luteifusca]MBM7489481.1 hypothetical protein [Micromonospora luteifusca]
MRTSSSWSPSRWLGQLRNRRGQRLGWLGRRAVGTVIASLAVLSAIVASIGWGISVAANSNDLTGRAISDDQMTTIATAARSCPMLTPARLSGQLMAESGLDTAASGTVSGGRGIAGLDDGDWKKWVPWPQARRTDTSANILALAHQVCDLSGQLRLAKVPGDQWGLSLAAFRAGLEAVRDAGGIPQSASDYVDKANAYANYYATLPQFGDASTRAQFNPTGAPAAVKPLPNTYVQPLLAAGKVCAQVPPSAVAAVLMAASQFNPNRLGGKSEQGIAQFRADLWQRYGPPNASAWNPAVAIPAVGTALCEMVKEFSALQGDPYLLALTAFRIGPDAVRQSGGTPDAATQAFLRDVASYTSYYALDTRLTAKPAAASPSPTTPATRPTPGTSPTPSPTVTATKPPVQSTKPAARSNQPAVMAKDARGTYGPYFIYNNATKLCVDLPGFYGGKTDGPVNQYPCAKTGTDNQEFVFIPRATSPDGHQNYWIRNMDDNFCLDPPSTGTVVSSTPLGETVCYDNDNQYFQLEPRFVSGGFEYYRLRNTVTGFCLDAPGKGESKEARLALVPCLDNDDHEWALMEKSEW